MRLTRSLPDYNWATRPILLCLCERVIVEQNVLITKGCTDIIFQMILHMDTFISDAGMYIIY
jgi:hypothetical protein